MNIKFTLFGLASLILFGSVSAQISLSPAQITTAQINTNATTSTNWNPNLLGTCAATCVPLNIPNPNSNPKGGGNDQTNNGNGTIATIYTMSACGLNYVLGEVKTGKRYSPAAANQPVAISITGIPLCKSILKPIYMLGDPEMGLPLVLPW
ncbi:MAG: hypothetical protein IPG08_06990 [Sphingobacteriaceae bacterium]|nr:hypothetical protein [Sphingobacteriaceae bacterium]